MSCLAEEHTKGVEALVRDARRWALVPEESPDHEELPHQLPAAEPLAKQAAKEVIYVKRAFGAKEIPFAPSANHIFHFFIPETASSSYWMPAHLFRQTLWFVRCEVGAEGDDERHAQVQLPVVSKPHLTLLQHLLGDAGVAGPIRRGPAIAMELCVLRWDLHSVRKAHIVETHAMVVPPRSAARKVPRSDAEAIGDAEIIAELGCHYDAVLAEDDEP